MPLKFSPLILAIATLLLAVSAQAQGFPPRPPGSIDYPPPDAPQPYPGPQQYPGQQQYPPQAQPQRQDPRGVQSQQLPPPPSERRNTRQIIPPPDFDNAPPPPPKAKAKANAKAAPKTSRAFRRCAGSRRSAGGAGADPAHLESDRGVFRSRQDYRPHHYFRCGDRRDGAVRRAAGNAACLLHAPRHRNPEHDEFVEVDEITLAGDIKRIFTGWMFATSPGLHAVEHPIYDVWIKDCKTTPPAIADSTGKQ